MQSRFVTLIINLLIGGLSLSGYCFGQETSEDYVELKPSFVTNYGIKGKLSYMKVDITVKVHGRDGRANISKHLPYIRNNIIMLLSSQTNETLNSPDIKDTLRKEALEIIKNILVEMEGDHQVDDLFFTNFIVQS